MERYEKNDGGRAMGRLNPSCTILIQEIVLFFICFYYVTNQQQISNK